MKIGIDVRSTIRRTLTGIGRYTFNLVNALSHLDSENRYYLYSRKRLFDYRRRPMSLPASNFSHCVDHFNKGPLRVLPELDVFHTSSYDLPAPERGSYVVTVHDVIIKAYPHSHNSATIRQMDKRLRRILDEADMLVADSYSTRGDLLRFYSVPGDRVQVIYPGASLHAGAVSAEREKRGDRYILFVGTLEPRKNVDGLIKAFNWLRKNSGISHRLYIAGMKGWMFERIFEEYEKSDFKKDIVFKGYVSDAELSALYRDADVFVYPSFYEGFGLPIVEAFAHRVPVVTSDTSSCSEVAGDAAVIINPMDYRAIGRAILDLIKDDNLRKDKIEKGLQRAGIFSWDRAAREFLELFEKMRQ